MPTSPNQAQAQAVNDLTLALKSLHVRAGEPSSRTVASAIGSMSHTTVSSAIRGDRVPTWPVLSKIVHYYSGDEEEFRQLWSATRESGVSAEMPAAPGFTEGADVSVFVSYARVDNEATYGRVREFVDSVKTSYESMTGQQVKVFRDTESIEAGEPWLDQIRSGIASSAILLAFVSPAYLRSQACISEYKEFVNFLVTSDSSIRVAVPLLFGDSDRINRYFEKDPFWLELKQLQYVDISMIRHEEIGSPTWIAKTEEVVDRVEAILIKTNDEAKGASGGSSAALTPSRPATPSSTAFLEAIAQAEESAPETIATIERIAEILNLIGAKTQAASVPMARATTAKKKLMYARRLAHDLAPISKEFYDKTIELRQGMTDWDTAVQAIAGRLRNNPDELAQGDTATALASMASMGRIGVQNLDSMDGFRHVVQATKGFSRELDVPLQVMEDSMRIVAEVRGTLAGWSETIDLAVAGDLEH